jgi:hypothetical protein
MRIPSPEYLLIFLLACIPLQTGAQVRIFADKVIEENTDLLVKGTGLKTLKACLWLYRAQEQSSACEDLYVRVNLDNSRAKIYLPSVDEDIQVKLIVTSGPYASDEQEFLISIKDVTNPKEELLKKFQFFTKPASIKGYSLAAKREDAVNFIVDESKFSPGEKYNKPAVYTSQDLTMGLSFDQRRKKILETARRRKRERTNRPKFRDLFRIKPRSIPPEKPKLGDIFVSKSNALCIYMDSKWLKIVGSGKCVPDPVAVPVLPKPIPKPKKMTL